MQLQTKQYQPSTNPAAIVISSLALMSLFVINAQAAPSFDCKKASTPAEKTICSSKTLSQLDNAIATAYKQAQKDLADDATALAELKTSQRLFITTRNAEATPHFGNDYNMQEHMTAQLDVLRGITAKPRDGLVGEWRTSESKLWIGPVNKMACILSTHKVAPTTANTGLVNFWVKRKQDGDTLVVQGRDNYKANYDDWQLKLTPQGRMLELSYIRPSNSNRKAIYNPPFCSMNGF
ncbi:MAG: DUF1311 domain-containing protein [Polaromonas sp.]|nr:DUF1311 domain-containing protein [Polaromonas sp.]